MQGRQFCVYNQTSECFLSLGVREGDGALGRLGGLLTARPRRYDEGQWVQRPRGNHFVRIFSSRDLVFLDDKHRVLGSWNPFLRFDSRPSGRRWPAFWTCPCRPSFLRRPSPEISW